MVKYSETSKKEEVEQQQEEKNRREEELPALQPARMRTCTNVSFDANKMTEEKYKIYEKMMKKRTKNCRQWTIENMKTGSRIWANWNWNCRNWGRKKKKKKKRVWMTQIKAAQINNSCNNKKWSRYRSVEEIARQ